MQKEIVRKNKELEEIIKLEKVNLEFLERLTTAVFAKQSEIPFPVRVWSDGRITGANGERLVLKIEIEKEENNESANVERE